MVEKNQLIPTAGKSPIIGRLSDPNYWQIGRYILIGTSLLSMIHFETSQIKYPQSQAFAELHSEK